MLLAKLNLYPGRSLDAKLHNAFKSYIKWCAVKRKNTNIKNFSRRDFKMTTTLDIKCIVLLWV